MFDKLVESTKTKPSYRGGRIFILTGLMYAVLLTTLGVWTILGLNPGLAEGFDLTKLPSVPLTPTTPEQPKPLTAILKPTTVVQRTFTPPTEVPPIALPSLFERLQHVESAPQFAGGRPCLNCTGVPGGIPGLKAGEEPPPPPPAAKPKPTPEPTPEVRPVSEKPIKVSIGVLQGAAIRKIAPAYPAMGKAVRAQGPVQIQVTISEEGQVIEAAVLNGHPLLRQAALDAARQWLFRPTLLSNVPVKVQGVLTFNFTLN
jgi:TonB family protein